MAVVHKTSNEKFANIGRDITYNYWYNLPTETHNHEYFEFFITLSGEIDHFYNGKYYHVFAKQLVILKPGDVHCILPFKNCQTSAMHFNMPVKSEIIVLLANIINIDLLDKILNSSSHLCFPVSDADFEYISLRLQRLSACKEEEIPSILKLICLCCLDIINQSLTDSPLPLWLSDFLKKINSLEYFSKPISELYKLVPYSQPQLNFLIKKHLNTTLINYMTNKKIEYACELLSINNYSVLQISELAGFMSLSNFNHTFKKIKNVSPRKYRRQFVSQSKSAHPRDF